MATFADYRLAQQGLIGRGGCSDGIAKWECLADRTMYAVKHMTLARKESTPCFGNEVVGLGHVKRWRIPRTLKLREVLHDKAGGSFFVTELVKGSTVDELRNTPALSQMLMYVPEDLMLEAAAQLLDTLKHMHNDASGLVHLDISGGNIMLNHTGRSWELKLLDFGLSQKVNKRFPTVNPDGFTGPFACPELLHPWVVAYCGDTFEPPEVEVIGTAVDMWSTGVVCFEMLTGNLPFVPEVDPDQYVPPCLATPAEREKWISWDGIRRAQLSWAAAIGKAEGAGQPVDHSLADQIRHASKQPEEAVNFFVKLLHPIPETRCSALQATKHVYLHAAMQKITAADMASAAAPLTAPSTAPITSIAPVHAAAPALETAESSVSSFDMFAATAMHDMEQHASDVYIEADSAAAMSSLSSCSSIAPAQQRPTLFSKLLSFIKVVRQCKLVQAIAMAKDILLRKLMPQQRLLTDRGCTVHKQPNPFVAKWVSECAALYPFQPTSVPLPSNRMKHALPTLYHSTPVTARQHILYPKRDADASASLPADRLHSFAEGHPQVKPGSSAAMISLADNQNHADDGGSASSMTSSSDDQDSVREASSSSDAIHHLPDVADGVAADHRSSSTSEGTMAWLSGHKRHLLLGAGAVAAGLGCWFSWR